MTGAKKYYNLIENDITDLVIERDNQFECIIKDKNNTIYNGFILAKSKNGLATTVCEISFHKSDTDNKYQPRPTFKRINKKYEVKKVHGNALTQRISFQTGEDGYREFWSMVSFLNGFKDLIDTGDFNNEYQVVTDSEFVAYLKVKEKTGDLKTFHDLVDQTGTDAVAVLRTASTLKLLKSYREKINEFINTKPNETLVQNWIDEEEHKHRKERCLIFGLEFVNHAREAGASGDRYDLLTRIGTESEERVLIELKSPSAEVFDIKESTTINKPKKEYSIATPLARAIPQILEYRKTLEDKRPGDPELEKIGENKAIGIPKCIIVIGTIKVDARWAKNFKELKKSLSSGLEIWTYTDLYNKIDSTIQNLESDKNK